jgi:trk system potassium uptake protein TrkH
MQWIGGIGLVVAVLAGVLRMGGSLYVAEAGEEKIKPNVINTFKALWWIYALYTVAGAALFVAAGMPPFDAVNHSMTAIATGGMSVKNASIGAYDSLGIELVAMLLMLIGSISFTSHHHLLRGRIRDFFRDTQLRIMLAVLFVAGLLVMPWTSLRHGIFQAISAMTCTGFGTADLAAWPGFPVFVLILLMLVGGSSGSTAGALKIFRVGILAKSFWWNLRGLITPHLVIPKKFGNWTLKERDIRPVLLFALLYASFIAGGTLVLASQGYPLASSLFEVASAQGNVGLSMGLAGTGMTFIGKSMIIINMLVGRLEIWAVLVSIGALFIRR